MSTRLPVAFVPHGGGPWPFVNLGFPQHEVESLADYLRELRAVPRSQVKAVLVISAHWEESEPTLLTNPKPSLYYDYYGFPDSAYQLKWAAENDVDTVNHVRSTLQNAGFRIGSDGQRGYDHGTFVPLMLTWPNGDVPILQLSLKSGLDPLFHIRLGQALAPLRDEGLFIVGTGMTFHNMQAMRQPNGKQLAHEFHAWLKDVVSSPEEVRNAQLTQWLSAPAARFSHPREEHLTPLFVIAGAALSDKGIVDYEGTIVGWPHLGVRFG